jgi:hypothetical protein
VPTLIKLALHRASDMVLLIGIPIVAVGLVREMHSGSIWRSALAGAMLLSPFLAPPGFPVALSFLLTFPGWRSPSLGFSSDYILAWMAAAIAAYIVAATLWWGDPGFSAYTGGAYAIAAFGAFVAIAFANRYALRSTGTLPMVAAVAACAAWAIEQGSLDPESYRSGVAYREAQEWARRQTPSDTLFLVDPTIYYGWRDYSRRSSFGNMREWLHTSWLYDSKPDRFHEGVRRLAEFGLSAKSFADRYVGNEGYNQLHVALQSRFYGATDEQLEAIAVRNGAKFIVCRKALERAPRSLDIAFSNSEFVIYAASGG